MDYLELGRRLKEYRISAGLSQEKLAELTNLSAVFISQLENARKIPSLDSIVKVCAALNIPLTGLLQNDNSEDEDKFFELFSLLKDRNEDEVRFVTSIVREVLKHMIDGKLDKKSLLPPR